jgi:hypothetical protein
VTAELDFFSETTTYGAHEWAEDFGHHLTFVLRIGGGGKFGSMDFVRLLRDKFIQKIDGELLRKDFLGAHSLSVDIDFSSNLIDQKLPPRESA